MQQDKGEREKKHMFFLSLSLLYFMEFVLDVLGISELSPANQRNYPAKLNLGRRAKVVARPVDAAS